LVQNIKKLVPRLTESVSDVAVSAGCILIAKQSGRTYLLVDATLVLQRGKFGILEESSAVAGDDPKNFGIAIEWISSE